MKTAILYVTHIFNEVIERQIVRISDETKEISDFFVIYQAESVKIDLHNGIRTFPFTIKELNMLGYKSWGCTLMDGNFHFVLLDFFLHYPDYDYYWLVEYDVRFSGCWSKFFSFFGDKDEDFISAHIEIVDDNPNWTRWGEIEMVNVKLNNRQLVKSFNPVARFSNRALGLLHERCRMGDRGHNEVLMPTLFSYYRLKIADFGGRGRLCRPEFDYYDAGNP